MRMRPDPEAARDLLIQPWAWMHMTARVAPKDWSPVESADAHWLVSDDRNACFPIVRNRQNLWEIHAAVTPHARRFSRQYARAAISWAKHNTDCRYLTAVIARRNLRARCLARLVGMKPLATLPGALASGDAMLFGLEMQTWAA